MSTTLDELLSALQTASIGTVGTNLFQTSKHSIPEGDGPYLSLREFGGSFSHTHNRTVSPAYDRSAITCVTRAKTVSAASDMAEAALVALFAIRNTTISGTWYQMIKLLSRPRDIGLDGKQRIMFSFDFQAIKRPSV